MERKSAVMQHPIGRFRKKQTHLFGRKGYIGYLKIRFRIIKILDVADKSRTKQKGCDGKQEQGVDHGSIILKYL
jgi:hypothetical protein